jgi:hypothetical protein
MDEPKERHQTKRKLGYRADLCPDGNWVCMFVDNERNHGWREIRPITTLTILP